MTDPYSTISFERSLLVPSNGTPIGGAVILRHPKFSPTYAANAPYYNVACRCRERVCQEREPNKSCFVFAEVSGRMEPSELVLGITSKFKDSAKEDYNLHARPIEEASTGSIQIDSAVEVGRSFRTSYKVFTCQWPEP